MKGWETRRILASALAALLALAVLPAVLPTLPVVSAQPTKPIRVWWIEIRDQTNRALAGEDVLIAVWNQTPQGNCAIAFFKGKTDDKGRVTLRILVEYPIYADATYPGQTFNITIAINKYGRWLLLNMSRNISWELLNKTYINKTVIATNWWPLRFRALTDPDGDGTYTPLYFHTGLGEDLASFRIYWNDTRVLITEIGAKSDGYARVLFNISDTELVVSEIAPGCFIFRMKPVVLYKEVVWNLFVNKGEYLPVKVGAEILEFDRTAKTVTVRNATPIGTVGAVIGPPLTLAVPTDITNYAYTVYYRVRIMDACGTPINTGALAAWKVFFQATVEGRSIILRSGLPAYDGTAPAAGAPVGGVHVFWIPDITKVYGKKFNVTLNINYYNIQVFTASIPTNRTELDLSDIAVYLRMRTKAGIREVDASTSIVKTRIVVKDSQPTPQPLAGARIVIIPMMVKVDPIYTATGIDGVVFLPPFETFGAAEGAVDYARVYRSVYDGYGYLPVPFTYRVSRSVATYAIRIEWILPGGETWFDVTPAENTFTLDIYKHITGGCGIETFTFFARVYELKVRVIDLCDRPLTSTIDPNASLILYIDGKRAGAVGLGADGTVDVGLIPGGRLRFRLYWKRVLLDPVAPVDAEIAVTKNIGEAVTLKFPVGDLDVTMTMWDVNYPIHKLNVRLQYVKDGRVVYEEPFRVTDCYGKVTFTYVPLRPLAVEEAAGFRYELRIVAYTRSDTPYIRPVDAGLLVANTTVTFDRLTLGCKNSVTVPAWIYSFKVIAVDHAGVTLRGLPTDIGVIPVAILLNDSRYPPPISICCPDICPPPTCICPPPGVVTVDYQILNQTTGDAIFVYYSQQYYMSDPEKDIVGIQPHMFVAGAKYHFMVFHGGVLVYNYTITLPRPFETVTVPIREAGVERPLFAFKGAPSWMDPVRPGKRAEAELRLFTWVQTLEVTTMTNACKYAVPRLNLTLVRTDVLNWTIVGGKYDLLSKPETWGDKWTNYAWSAVGGADGVVRILVPVWVPSRTDLPWIRRVKFGANITHVAVLAASRWASPGVPDTPLAHTLTLKNAAGRDIAHRLYGYIVNWNHTKPGVTIDAREFFPLWTKAGVRFRGNNTKWYGDFWNMTYWSGASKTVRTLAMDGFCVTVLAPPPCPGEPAEGLANVPVWVEAVGHTRAKMEIARGVTDATGTAKFAPTAVYAYKFDVPGTAGLPNITYVIYTKQNFEEILKPYGLDEAKAGLCPEILSISVKFAERHNDFKECVTLTWEAIYLYVEDWGGKPLLNMMVTATAMYPTPSGGITTFDFSRPFAGSAVARLLVKRDSAYTVTVYWRDSYLLAAAGAIPRYINIYDSFADEITPRLFASEVMQVPGFVTSAGGTIKTFVYIGLIELRTKEGKTLSPEALAKITVTITWPDGVVTTVKPGTDGVAPIILNKDTVRVWHPDPRIAAATSKYNPESPHPQSPAGDYKVVVEWAGVGKIAEKTLRITRAKLDTPEIREPVYVDVVDVTITLTTPFNTPMAGATVRVTKLDGTTLELTADAQGRITVPEAPLGRVDVTVVTWNGMPINFPAGRVAAGAVTVTNVGRLVVTVVGARGQGLEGARVSISGAGVSIVGTTDAAGKFAVELPAGTYTVTAEKGGRTASESVTIAGGRTEARTLKVDVFMTLAGWEMSFSEFVGLLLLIALLAIVLFIIAHEYAVWRRRRLARAIVPARPEGA